MDPVDTVKGRHLADALLADCVGSCPPGAGGLYCDAVRQLGCLLQTFLCGSAGKVGGIYTGCTYVCHAVGWSE